MGELNPNIILSIGQNAQQQQPPNLLGQYQAMQQIQANKLAMQAQQQSYQTAGIKQQEAQMALQQQQLAAKQQQDMVALIQQSGGDVRKAIQQGKAQGNQQAFVLEKNQDEAEQLVTKTKKDAEDAAKTHLETTQKGLDRIGSMADRVLGTTPELQGVAYQSVRAQAQALQIPGADQLPPVWDESAKAALQNIRQGSITAADQIKQKLEAGRDVETGRHNQAQESQAATNETNLQGYRGAEVQNMNASRQLEAKRVGIEGARLGLEKQRYGQQYGDATAGMSKGNLVIAQKLAAGEMSPQMLGRMPGKEGIVAAAVQIAAQNGVNWTPQIYEAKKDFKTGKDSGDIGSMTRVLGHLERYSQNSDSLGTAPSLSMGITNTANSGLRKDVTAIGDEFGYLVKHGALTQEQSHEMQQGLLSPIQSVRTKTIGEVKQLMGSQFEAKFQKYKTATGQDLNPQEFFDKDTQKRLVQNYPGLVSGAAAGSGVSPGVTAAPGVPTVGAMFNGEKVLKVTRVK
jgi:hypothetical protein